MPPTSFDQQHQPGQQGGRLGGGGGSPPAKLLKGRLPAANGKPPPQAVPGLYIVHAAPFYSLPLDGQGQAVPRPGAPDYKWSARMSPPPAHRQPPAGGRGGPDSRRASCSPGPGALISTETGSAVRGPDTAEAFARAYVQAEVSGAARLRGARPSLGGLQPGPDGSPTSGLGPPAHHDAGNADVDLVKLIRNTLRPMGIILVLYGMIPIQFFPPRLSVHPLRSTVLYVVLVQTVVSLSVHHVYASYSSLLHTDPSNGRGVDERLLAVLSIMHVSSHAIVGVIWSELRKTRPGFHNLAEFVRTYGHMVGSQPLCRWTRFMPWYSVVFCIILGPAMVVVWCIYILKASVLMHGPSHLVQIVNVFSSLVLFATCCMVVRDLAHDVAKKLKEELDSGKMTASRLEEFRLAWMKLRELTTALGSMPLTGLSMVFYLLIMVTLTAYQTAVSYFNNYILLCAASTCILALCNFALIHICDTAHRLTDVMTNGFYEPLESRSWRGLPPDLLTEHQQFLHTISTSPAEVTFAGMIIIKRSTYLNIMAAIATYLIVLFQLRMADEELPATPTPPVNSTDSSLDSVYSSGT